MSARIQQAGKRKPEPVECVCGSPARARGSALHPFRMLAMLHLVGWVAGGLFAGPPLLAGPSTAETRDGAPIALVTEDRTVFPVSEARHLLERMLSGDDAQTPGPFILFVHGRGEYPERAFAIDLLEEMASDYSARVLMFNWDAWNGPFGFPEDQARAAGEALTRVLEALRDARRERRARQAPEVPCILLAHSMGALVLEESVRRGFDAGAERIFENVILSAPACGVADHAPWVERMDWAGRVYVVANDRDPVLGFAHMRGIDRRLGSGWMVRGVVSALASNALYINATRIGLRHRYYMRRYQEEQPSLMRLYDAIMSGRAADLSREAGLLPTAQANVFVLGPEVPEDRTAAAPE